MVWLALTTHTCGVGLPVHFPPAVLLQWSCSHTWSYCCVPLQSVIQEAGAIHRQSTVSSSGSSPVGVSRAPQQFLVKTSFYKCSWNLEMFRLGSAKEAAVGEG